MLMDRSNFPSKYSVQFALASGANLELLMFSHDEHRWLFTYNYSSASQGMSEVLTNDIVLRVDYESGISKFCRMSMDMIWPARRGKQQLFGMDVSENSRMFLEFLYEKSGQSQLYNLKTIRSGQSVIDLESQKEGLIKSTDFPFPIERTLQGKYDVYKIPFLKNDGSLEHFEFPDNCIANR